MSYTHETFAASRSRGLARVRRPASWPLLGLAWLAMLGPDLQSTSAITVEQRPAAVDTRTFDPAAPPAEMPHLGPRERAITHSEFGIGAEVRVLVRGDFRQGRGMASVVEVDGLDLDLGLEITEWLPEGAPASLVEHEDGHRRISELFYQDAEAIARRLGARYVGKSFRGEGRTVEQARRAAMDGVIRELNLDYLAATHSAASRVNELFDQITSHGRNDVPVDQAMRDAIASWRREERAGDRAAR